MTTTETSTETTPKQRRDTALTSFALSLAAAGMTALWKADQTRNIIVCLVVASVFALVVYTGDLWRARR